MPWRVTDQASLLESVERSERWGRFSFVGATRAIVGSIATASIPGRGRPLPPATPNSGDAGGSVALAGRSSARVDGLPSLTGGLMACCPTKPPSCSMDIPSPTATPWVPRSR